jgi:tRNA(Ile)-lysidine synthase
MTIRPRLTPAIADVRRAVRTALAAALPTAAESTEPTERAEQADPTDPTGPTASDRPLVLVALSGGADSLALAAATAFEAPRLGLRAGAVIVDHRLQPGSADAAADAARAAAALGLDPVLVREVTVDGTGGPEAAARDARYAALDSALTDTGAIRLLLGHTLDDQAETVLLGLARGSGASSLWGMSRESGHYLRPLLGIRRRATEQACADAGLDPWHDPQNVDSSYARVRVRQRVLPTLESELGPGVAEALARTAEQLREDAEALDHFASEIIEELAEPAEAGISLPVAALAANPPALRQRLIRLAVRAEFHVSLGRAHTLEVARLVTEWHGQGPLDLPGVRVERRHGLIVFSAGAIHPHG